MRAAGVNQADGPVVPLDLASPRPLRDGEILLQVQAAGVGNWDEFVRTGDWDTGARPPMALGVEAAGTVAAVGDAVPGFRPGDRVCTHTLPLPDQGCWAELFIATAAQTAPVPPGVPWDVAAAFPVPALTADQALSGALQIRPGETVLVHGGGGGADAAVNAARAGAADAVRAVRPGGRLATITGDPPPAERGITVSAVQVEPDGPRLARLAGLLGHGVLRVTVGASFPLDQAAQALAQVRRGAHGTAIVLRPRSAEVRR